VFLDFIHRLVSQEQKQNKKMKKFKKVQKVQKHNSLNWLYYLNRTEEIHVKTVCLDVEKEGVLFRGNSNER
jgi:serine/threonine-protein kinase RIO1